MINFIKNKLTRKQKVKLVFKWQAFKSIFYFFNLNKLALIHGTDKFGSHFYTPHYQKYFRKFKFKSIKLLEIGVGGYSDPLMGANSLRMWKSYFPFAKIFSLDIHDKSLLQESRIKIYQGSQVDEILLNQIISEHKEFDIIVDDGSHINEHVITTFIHLFPVLKSGGIYVIEDTQTSYWEHYGGTSHQLNDTTTIMGFFKSLVDGLNHQELVLEHYQKSYYDQNIIGIHFYHNLIFIEKGENNERSNYIINNQIPNGAKG